MLEVNLFAKSSSVWGLCWKDAGLPSYSSTIGPQEIGPAHKNLPVEKSGEISQTGDLAIFLLWAP